MSLPEPLGVSRCHLAANPHACLLGRGTSKDAFAFARFGPRVPSGGGSNVIEVFSPPYLFQADGTPAARPTITDPP
jgi:hypothetical protein